MRITATTTEARSILTRTSGYLKTVASHSLQPYRGCSFGQSLCGVGCYVQHSPFVTGGAAWGSFVVAKTNAGQLYRCQNERERRWSRGRFGEFSIFMSSATDPFLPHERKFKITAEVLEAMLESPPDTLILQTHSHCVLDSIKHIEELAAVCSLRVHISIETDRERLRGLPPPPSPVSKRLDAARTLRAHGIRTVITVAPLLPIAEPERFFLELSAAADAIVLDHFVGGDGSKDGARTRKTRLPAVMEAIEPGSSSLRYRDRMFEIADRIMPGRVGVGIDGFANRFGGALTR